MSIVPSWVALGRRHIGLKEIEGKLHNDEIVKFWDDAKIKLRVVDDETPWCAAFVGAMLERTGYQGTGSGMARSYANTPSLYARIPPALGAIVVLESNRGKASGHVGFMTGISADQSHILLLGGNQGNRVSEDLFKFSRIVGCYWPIKAPPFDKYILPIISQAPSQEVSDS